jgi:AsmA-like C-terminal region
MPAILERPSAITRRRASDREPTLLRRLGVSAVRFAVVLALSAFITGAWYLSKKGFGREWRYRITEELHKRGVEAHIRRLTLDPFRGLVAKDVRIFEYKRRENTLARVSEIALDINYAALLHHQPFLNALDIRNAQITLPIKSRDAGPEQAQLTNFRAHIYFPPEQIYVSQAEGMFCGVRISATGQLIKRASYQPSTAMTEEEWRRRMSVLRRIALELQKFAFPRGHPSLQVKFSGDLEQLEDAHVEATLQGKELRRGAYAITDLFASAEWTDQVFNVSRCEWRDAGGAFAARGSWSRQTNEANFQIRSEIALKDFLDAFSLGRPLRDLAFTAPPLLEISGLASVQGEHPQIKVIGRASVGAFSYKAVPFAELSGRFSWDGEHTLLRDVRLRDQTGDLAAQLFDAPNDFRLKIDSNLTPAVLRPLVSPELSKFLAEWELPRPPEVHLTIRAPDRNPENWKGEGTIALERARFRGASMNSATADVRFGDGAIVYDNLRVTRDEGVGTGSFTYDFKNHEVRINNIKTSLRPAEAILWVDPKLWKTIVPYKFRHAPNITTNGVYQFRGGKNTHIDITLDAPGGMDYGFIGKALPFDRVASHLLLTNDRLQIVDFKAGLFSGTVRGTADISLAKNDPRYRAKIAVGGINFPQLTGLYYNYKAAPGTLSGNYDFTGLGNDPRRMQGSGTLEVTNGDVFAIPVFGPLSGILNSIIPGAGYSIAHRASARFTIKNGIIHTDDFDAAGRMFRLLGHGDIHFLDDKLDFYLRIGGKGPSVLLTPVYKLFEYVGEGSLKHPDWHPKRF